MKKVLFLLAALAAFVTAHAVQSGDAIGVLNAFIATFAKDNPAWKSDIVALSDPSNVPAGRQLGYSAVLGYYSFIPKSWSQLTEGEKQAAYADPRLKPFIVSLRNYNNYPSLTNTDTPRPAFPVYPVEGVRPVCYAQPMYTAPYYSPAQLSPSASLVQPVTVVAPSQPQVSRLKVSPEEMLMDRPIKIYMQDK